MEQFEIERQTENHKEPQSMIQFIISKGWTFLSPCGCRSAMDKYVSQEVKYKNYEIWVNKPMTIFQIRIKNNHTSIKIAFGNEVTFKNVYDNYLPK